MKTRLLRKRGRVCSLDKQRPRSRPKAQRAQTRKHSEETHGEAPACPLREGWPQVGWKPSPILKNFTSCHQKKYKAKVAPTQNQDIQRDSSSTYFWKSLSIFSPSNFQGQWLEVLGSVWTQHSFDLWASRTTGLSGSCSGLSELTDRLLIMKRKAVHLETRWCMWVKRRFLATVFMACDASRNTEKHLEALRVAWMPGIQSNVQLERMVPHQDVECGSLKMPQKLPY